MNCNKKRKNYTLNNVLSINDMDSVKAGVKGKGNSPSLPDRPSCTCAIRALDVDTFRCMACGLR